MALDTLLTALQRRKTALQRELSEVNTQLAELASVGIKAPKRAAPAKGAAKPVAGKPVTRKPKSATAKTIESAIVRPSSDLDLGKTGLIKYATAQLLKTLRRQCANRGK